MTSEAAAAAEAAATTTFTFAEDGVTAEGETAGYKISGTTLTINEAGTYVVTGTCDEGNIVVKKGTTGVVLVLRDLALTSTQTAPVSCNKATDVTIVVRGDVSLTDAEDPANEDSADEAVADAFEGAVIKVKSGATLTVTGDGELTLDGSACKNGIKGASEATVVIGTDADDVVSLVVKAANNGVASDGAVVVNGGNLYIEAGNDGIKSEPDEDDEASAGTVTVNGGEVDIIATGDGIQATNDLVVNGGDIAIKTNGGYKTKLADDADSCKGLKSDTSIVIVDGDIAINAADDAVHSNGNITITGGILELSSGDDAVHADGTLMIGEAGAASGPEITVLNSYEGLEGANIVVNAGVVDITASDDGVNAANKDLGESYAFTLEVNGGTLRVNAGGDGLDSNGTITVNGGNLEIFGSANDGNAAMDIGDRSGAWVQNGGSIIAVGMSGMAVVPTSGTYVSFGANIAGMGGMQQGGMGVGGFGQMGRATNGVSVSAGSSIVIKDSAGSIVYETTAVKSANSIVFSSDDLVSGQTYTLYVDGTAVGSATATTGTGQATGMGAQPNGQAGGPSNVAMGGQQGNQGMMPRR